MHDLYLGLEIIHCCEYAASPHILGSFTAPPASIHQMPVITHFDSQKCIQTLSNLEQGKYLPCLRISGTPCHSIIYFISQSHFQFLHSLCFWRNWALIILLNQNWKVIFFKNKKWVFIWEYIEVFSICKSFQKTKMIWICKTWSSSFVIPLYAIH